MSNALETFTNAHPEGQQLREGELLSQLEFHRRYKLMNDGPRYELLKGVVSMTPAERLRHGRYEQLIGLALGLYEAQTPGSMSVRNATLIFDHKNELQPDLHLRIVSELEGQSSVDDEGYVNGPPELVVEIAYSSLRRDLTVKRDIYHQQGVREYLVVCVEPAEFRWFVWPDGEREIDADGILRSVTFPGLWIDSHALFQEQIANLILTLQMGFQTPAHAEFVRQLEARKLP